MEDKYADKGEGQNKNEADAGDDTDGSSVPSGGRAAVAESYAILIAGMRNAKGESESTSLSSDAVVETDVTIETEGDAWCTKKDRETSGSGSGSGSGSLHKRGK